MRSRPLDKCRAAAGPAGFTLLLVLTAVALLSFAVYAFSGLMATSVAAGRTGLMQLQRRQLAESALELASQQIQAGRVMPFNEPLLLKLPDGTEAVLAVLPQFPADRARPLFGVQNESAKLNLNTLPTQPSRRQQALRRLMAIPQMSDALASAIMDWLDPDDEPSENGAEVSWYLSQSPPRLPANGPFRELHELLQVRGITAELLYGEDHNGNGLLDPEENDENRSLPPDNGDGILQAGLSQYLTTVSAESMLSSSGAARIWLNNPDLPRLYDQIQAKFGSEAALFLTAGRLAGINWLDDVRPDEGADQDIRRLERLEQARERLNAQLGLNPIKGLEDGPANSSRGGLRLDRKSVFQYRSLLDLFGGQIRLTLGGKDQVLESPWVADAATMDRMLPEFEQVFTITNDASLPGRININLASEAVLSTLPGLSSSQARAIAQLQPSREGPEQTGFETVAWLHSRGVLSAGELRAVAPLITTRGSVVSGLAVGQLRGHPAAAAVQFLADFSGRRGKILWMKDLPVIAAEVLGLNERTIDHGSAKRFRLANDR
jgi:type II secretory pathway component PulK